METETFYITTAIDYPNGIPHMGHAYEKAVADFYARWYRLRGLHTRFLTGLDEHGQKIEEAARAAGQEPQAFVDEKAQAFQALCRALDVSNDDFIRTSEERHRRYARELWSRVQAKGDIYSGFYEGQYCVACESYYTESQLEAGNCPVHKRPTELLRDESYFFRLGQYRDWIREHIRTHEEFIYPPERRNEILARLDEEVRDLSISRSTFDWGVPVPGDSKHIMYVWFDALSNYISALKEPEDIYARFWPAQLHVIGKDIIWFHTVIWPCMLRSADLPLPRQVYAHGFILDAEGRKMAKHLGNVVEPLAVLRDYGADVVRYYLLRAFSSGQDGRFSLEELAERYQSELGNDLGNLVLRVVQLVEAKLGGRIDAPPHGVTADLDPAPVAQRFAGLVDRREHNRALDALWSFIREVNAYLNDRAPWKEQDQQQIARVLYNALEALRGIAYLISPAMPTVGASVALQIGAALGGGPLAPFGSGTFAVNRGKPLFPRRDEPRGKRAKPAESDRPAKKPGGGAAPVDPFAKLDIRVARIDAVREHPDADALYVFSVRLAEGDGEGATRTICAGLREHLSPAELEGRNVVILANLKPARLRGIESHGMVLATDRRDGKVAPVDPGDAPLGDRARVEGIEPQPKSKLSTKDFDKAPLTMAGGRVVYAGKPLRTSTGELRAEAEDGARVR